MNMNDTKRRRAQAIAILVGVTLAVTFLPSRASAQSTESKPAETKSTDSKSNQETVVQTIFLTHATQMNDLNDAQTALRNVLPRAKIYGLATQDAITLRATPEDMEIAKKLIACAWWTRTFRRSRATGCCSTGCGMRGVPLPWWPPRWTG